MNSMNKKYNKIFTLIKKDGHSNPQFVTYSEIKRIANLNKIKLTENEILDLVELVWDNL